eukprot:7379281-Prymnesium_polylepis.1
MADRVAAAMRSMGAEPAGGDAADGESDESSSESDEHGGHGDGAGERSAKRHKGDKEKRKKEKYRKSGKHKKEKAQEQKVEAQEEQPARVGGVRCWIIFGLVCRSVCERDLTSFACRFRRMCPLGTCSFALHAGLRSFRI